MKNSKFPVRQGIVERTFAIYEDEHFKDWDYDVIGIKTRNTLRKNLIQAGFQASGSRYFELDGTQLMIPKPMGVLGGNLSEYLCRTYNENNQHILLSSTQAILLFLNHSDNTKDLSPIERILDFCKTHPFNIPFILKQRIENERFAIFKQNKDQIMKTTKEHFLKRKRGR